MFVDGKRLSGGVLNLFERLVGTGTERDLVFYGAQRANVSFGNIRQHLCDQPVGSAAIWSWSIPAARKWGHHNVGHRQFRGAGQGTVAGFSSVHREKNFVER